MNKRTIQDARGSLFEPYSTTPRIVSLVPSITELLFDLGLDVEAIVGRTKFCTQPSDKVKDVPWVGGTKDFKIDRIQGLRPDLVLANIDENPKDRTLFIERKLKKTKVFATEVNTYDDALAMINDLGRLLQKGKEAKRIIDSITALREKLPQKPIASALYLIWKRPYMSVSPGTYIDDMMRISGYENVISEDWLANREYSSSGKRRYPEIAEKDILTLNPDRILLSSEPYPFKEKHIIELTETLSAYDPSYANTVRISIVDGRDFSWFGSHLISALKAFSALH